MIPALPNFGNPIRLAFDGTIVASRVRHVDGSTLLVEAPVDTSGEASPLLGSAMTLHYTSARGTCELPVTLLGAERADVPVWRLEASGSVELIQRREYARASADGSAALIPLSRTGITSVRTGWLVDISEGGARCSFPAGQLRPGDMVELHMDLGGYRVIVEGAVARIDATPDADEVVIAYDAADRAADRIRSYVFARQRSERRADRGTG